jgi:hypothetical protein
MRKKTDYRETLGSFQVHMKDGREKFLEEVAKWYTALYPARAEFFMRSMRRLRETAIPACQTKNGEMRCEYRVPQELFLFIQRWIPDFGDDHSDIELMCRVWCDLVRPTKDYRRRTRLTCRK